MQVILLERVENLGTIGDVVTVRPGYARNYLLPQHKALRATEANKKRFEASRAEIEARNAEARARAAEAGAGLNGQSFVLIRQAGESGQLYGSVSARDIAEAAAAAGFKVERSAVALDTPIKTIGLHSVRLKLHAEVAVSVTINVARSTDEAERQAKGEDVVAAALEEERALANEQAQEIAAVAAAEAAASGPRDE